MKINIFTIVYAVLIALRIAGVIDWSWWLLLSPILFSLVLAIVICCIIEDKK